MRLKGLDACFLKMKKLCILPQSPLISATIEEGKFWRISKIAKNTIFRFFDPSSNIAEIVEYWGRIHNNFILWKYTSRAFKRTISRLLKPKIHRERSNWNFMKNHIFEKIIKNAIFEEFFCKNISFAKMCFLIKL